MKYKDLPKEKILNKLLQISFDTPQKNLSVYEWADSILKHVRFIENERVKLVKKYGTADNSGGMSVSKENVKEFSQKFSELLNMDIEEEISKCPVQKEWLEDSKCSFPQEHELWLTPSEIGLLINQ